MSDNTEITQAIVDQIVAEFQSYIDEVKSKHLSFSVALCVDKGLIATLAKYELEVIPFLKEHGYTIPTLEELTGSKITLTNETVH